MRHRIRTLATRVHDLNIANRARKVTVSLYLDRPCSGRCGLPARSWRYLGPPSPARVGAWAVIAEEIGSAVRFRPRCWPRPRPGPGGSVAQIDQSQIPDPDGYVPSEAIVEVWPVGADGKPTGEFVPNPHYGLVSDDFARLESPDHWLGWLPDTPAAAVSASIERVITKQVPGTTVPWIKVTDAPVSLTGGVRDSRDGDRIVVRRAGLAVPFALAAVSPASGSMCSPASYVGCRRIGRSGEACGPGLVRPRDGRAAGRGSPWAPDLRTGPNCADSASALAGARRDGTFDQAVGNFSAGPPRGYLTGRSPDGGYLFTGVTAPARLVSRCPAGRSLSRLPTPD